MHESGTNPFIVIIFFVARCMIPLFLMLGITYLLRKWGLIQDAPKPPEDWNGSEMDADSPNHNQGDPAHGHV